MPLKNKCEVSILVLPATMNKLTLQWEEPPLSMHGTQMAVTINPYRGRAPALSLRRWTGSGGALPNVNSWIYRYIEAKTRRRS